jgi:Protein of unknown function (DUF1565)
MLRSRDRWIRAFVPAAMFWLASWSTPATEWYVDAISGDDANDGTTPATAWHTLTHALASLPANLPGAQLIHAAPGSYSSHGGEQFPLVMQPLVRIVGDQGSAVTSLEAPGATLLLFSSVEPMTGYFVAATSGVDGFTLKNASIGIELDSSWNGVSPAFHDLAIRGMLNEGVSILASGVGVHVVHPSFYNTTITYCGVGIEVIASGAGGGSYGTSEADLTDSVIASNQAQGIGLASNNGSVQVSLERCRVTGNAGNGIFCDMGDSSGLTVSVHASLIAANQGSGVSGVCTTFSTSSYLITDSTIAGNADEGVQTPVGSSMSQFNTLRNCILFGNGNDLSTVGGLVATYCDCGNGNLDAFPQCIHSDPMFVNPALGDYRLRWGSPCIETGDPTSTGSIDLLGSARPLDGDLDTLSEVDMGAFEFETLHRIGTPSLGDDFGFEFWGAAGSSSILFSAKLPLTPAQSTPFGNFFLDPSSVLQLAVVPARPGPPFILRRTLPSNPMLIGTTFSFQALTDSSSAPRGQAYTNATSFVVTP